MLRISNLCFFQYLLYLNSILFDRTDKRQSINYRHSPPGIALGSQSAVKTKILVFLQLTSTCTAANFINHQWRKQLIQFQLAI
jgi:hypothetical protein